MIKTKASIAKEIKADKDFKVIKFDGIKKLPKTRPPQNKEGELNSEDEAFEAIFGDGPSRPRKPKKDKKEVTFDKARKEVMNFGICGSNSTDKSENIKHLMLKLGAKQPKKQARNYKEILEEKRKFKEEDEKINKRTLFGTSASLQNRSQMKKSRKNVGNLLRKYGRLDKHDKESIRKIKQNNNSIKRKR